MQSTYTMYVQILDRYIENIERERERKNTKNIENIKTSDIFDFFENITIFSNPGSALD